MKINLHKPVQQFNRETLVMPVHELVKPHELNWLVLSKPVNLKFYKKLQFLIKLIKIFGEFDLRSL